MLRPSTSEGARSSSFSPHRRLCFERACARRSTQRGSSRETSVTIVLVALACISVALLLFYRAPGGDPRALARLALLHGIERIRGESEVSLRNRTAGAARLGAVAFRSGRHRHELQPAVPAELRIPHPRLAAAGTVAGCARRLRREQVDELSPGDVERRPRLGLAGRDAFDGLFDLVDRRLQICRIHLKSSSPGYSTAARFPSRTLFVSTCTPAICLVTQARYAVFSALSSDRART